MVEVLGWILVLVLLHRCQHLGHALHELGLHDHHLLHGHVRRWRWWVREAMVVVVVSIGIGVASAAIGVFACPTPGVCHLK